MVSFYYKDFKVLNVFAQLSLDPTSNDNFFVILLYFQSNKIGKRQKATAFLPSSTATTKSNEVEETLTSSNHPKDLVTP